jgi:hypothetical protein
MATWAALALAMPGCLLALGLTAALPLAAFGQRVMWPHESYNLAEAAAARDEAEVVRLIEDGHDPNIRYPVQAGLVFEKPTHLTPLEAAIAANDAAVFRQLLAKGAAIDASLWAYLRCVADDSRVAPVLDAHRPPNVVLGCDGVRLPWHEGE